MAVTIKDVASPVDVGVGIASRVINDSSLVGDTMRRRVLQIMEEVAYAPNPCARCLPREKSLTLVVTTPFLIRPYGIERLHGAEAAVTFCLCRYP